MRWLLILLLPVALFASPFSESIQVKEEPVKVGYLVMGRESIGRSSWIKVRAALNHYKKEKVNFVILRLNTPGGEVFVSQEISDALRNLDTEEGIPVVAVIDNWALSAGAMLAYSCRYITTTRDGLMGAALPIMMTQEGKVQDASEKIRSVVRADFASRALFFERNPYIAEAMVDPDILLVERGSKVIPLNSESELKPGEKVISPKGKLLTLRAEEMVDLGIANFLFPVSSPTPTEEEIKAGAFPLSSTLLSQIPFFANLQEATVIAYKPHWKEHFFSILTLPIISSLLFLGLMLGFYMEINTPGFGFPGVVALVCLFFIILSSFALEAMGWLEISLLALGLLLIALEIFVIPGFGIAGVLGILFTVVGLVAMLLPGLKNFKWDFDTGMLNPVGEELLIRLAWIGGAVIVAVIAMWLLSRYVLPKVSRFSHLVLRGEQEAHRGYVAGIEASKLPLPGAEGEALSPLRPSGKVVIEDQVYDATTTGGYIAKGVLVVVIKRGSTHLIVEEKGC